jgi:organic hydroperoxide reductase OsmC/OhrA
MTDTRRVAYTAEAHVSGGRADGHGRTSDGALEVELAVSLPSVADPDEPEALVRRAHQGCPSSKATRGNIDVALIANGRNVDDRGAAAA